MAMQQTSGKVLGAVAIGLLAGALVLAACDRSVEPPTQPQGDEQPTGATPTTVTTLVSEPVPPPSAEAPINLQWTESGLSGETFLDQLIATKEGFVAYRFSDGFQAWVSDDGIDWIPMDLVFEAATDLFRLFSITAGGPGYVAIGTTSDYDAVNDEVMWTSEDGFTWKRHDLDLERPELGIFASIGVRSVVRGPDGLVLTGRMAGEDGPFVVWTSVDGSDWDLVEDPFGAGAYIGEILPAGDGFVTHGYVEGPDGGGERFWLSTDGRSWEESPADFLNDSGFYAEPGLVRWGEKILSVVNTDEGIRLWTSTEGRTWEQLPASPTLSQTDEFNIFVMEVAAGPLGIVLMGELVPPQQPLLPVVIEKDDVIVTIDLETFRVTVTDRSTGDVLLEAELFDSDTSVFNEDDSITLLHPDSGEELVTVTPEEFEEAQAKAFKEAGIEPGFGEEQPTPVLWFSPDGQRWTSMGIEETFGIVGIEGIGSAELPSEVVVGNDAVILRWSDRFEFVDGSEEDLEILPELIWVGRLTDEP